MSSAVWERDNIRFEISRDSGAVEVVVPALGWVRANQSYSICATETRGWESRIWVVVSAASASGDTNTANGIVIESVTAFDADDPVPFCNLRVWRVPAEVLRLPSHLVGSDTEAIELWLMRSVAIPLVDFRLDDETRKSIPEVGVDTIEPQVSSFLGDVVHEIGKRGQFEIAATPVAAAREYIETDPASNLNETVFCYWRWRLTYLVRRNSASGFLTAEVRGATVDASDQEGANHLDCSTIAAWLSLPGNQPCTGAQSPGTPVSACGTPPAYSR
jgi:hypothetical protein